MRYSTNEEVNATVKNGFDYDLQVWVKDYKIILAESTKRTEILKGIDIRELKKDISRKNSVELTKKYV